ncbi:hypothetical protein Y1Q_0014335 [Alligator mississippiensis]|uniref:Uncharacterized protein n=1 Tax=Alligator mississippiensis TaxID=8496 RepID=A0A151N269_ALLMI|nr:hypothetical protein Y1Q_0014335 [Alligator mississippiensis]
MVHGAVRAQSSRRFAPTSRGTDPRQPSATSGHIAGSATQTHMKPGLETLILRCKWTEMERTSLSLVLETRGGLVKVPSVH